MQTDTLKTLLSQNHISENQYTYLDRIYSRKLFSLYYELRTMLSLGVLLFTVGVGILIYLNIDTIGHQAIILILSVLTAGCFWYVVRIKPPYANEEVASPSLPYDYVLFLGCLLFSTIIGYVQFQYAVFGERWELGALIPALVFIPCAYFFDHRGVLSLAIVGLATWLGLTVSPIDVIKEGIIPEGELIFSGLILGLVLVLAGAVLHHKKIKRHFTFTYYLFGSQLMFISSLSALVTLEQRWLYFLLLMGLTVGGMLYARREQSFFFVLISAIYGYIGITYMIAEKLFPMDMTLWFLYLIVSGGLMLYGLFHYKKMFGKKS